MRSAFKHCPRCATAGLAISAEQLIVCPHCGFTYYHNTAAAVAAIIEHDSQILLTKRAKDPHADLIFICAAEGLSGIKTSDEIHSVEFYPPSKIPFDQIAFESTKTGLRRYVDGAGNSDANI